MAIEQLLSLVGFILVMVGTPGPNNIMLMASGVKFGIRRSIPHLLGIAFGCQLLIVAAAFGLGRLLALYPGSVTLLQWVSALFLCYLAWVLVGKTSGANVSKQASHPIRFWQSTLFQWVNPKAWMICIALVSTYTQPARLIETTAWISLIFLLVGTPMMIVWNVSGMALKDWLQQGRRLLWFNRVMAVLLLASLLQIVPLMSMKV